MRLSAARVTSGSASRSRARRSRRPDGTPSKAKILIVEDEFLLALQTEQLLLESGFTVAGMAADAPTAVRLAGETRPDLVLMDIRLNGPRDGVDAAVEIRDRFGIRSLFVTGNAETARTPRAAAAKAAGVLSKPYRESEVVAAVNQALAQPRNG